MTDVRDTWNAGPTYEAFMGRWSRELAPRFVSWLGIPPGSHWLDVGCGTGALSEAIRAHAAPASVTGCDPSEAFVDFARNHSRDERMSFVTAGVGGLPARKDGYGSVTSSLALNFFPDPGAGVREMRSLASKGGAVSACVWDYAGKMEFLRRFWDAAVALDPGCRELDEGARFPICRPEVLTPLFREAGLDGVRCEAIDIVTQFPNFTDYWEPLLGGTGPAPSYVASLAPDRREALARSLEKSLGRPAGAPIDLVARAWAVRGSVPA